MDESSHEMSDIAFGLFDRWGDLKQDYVSHPIKKGRGALGKELNKGEFLMIESFEVHKDYRRKGSDCLTSYGHMFRRHHATANSPSLGRRTLTETCTATGPSILQSTLRFLKHFKRQNNHSSELLNFVE